MKSATTYVLKEIEWRNTRRGRWESDTGDFLIYEIKEKAYGEYVYFPNGLEGEDWESEIFYSLDGCKKAAETEMIDRLKESFLRYYNEFSIEHNANPRFK